MPAIRAFFIATTCAWVKVHAHIYSPPRCVPLQHLSKTPIFKGYHESTMERRKSKEQYAAHSWEERFCWSGMGKWTLRSLICCPSYVLLEDFCGNIFIQRYQPNSSAIYVLKKKNCWVPLASSCKPLIHLFFVHLIYKSAKLPDGTCSWIQTLVRWRKGTSKCTHTNFQSSTSWQIFETAHKTSPTEKLSIWLWHWNLVIIDVITGTPAWVCFSFSIFHITLLTQK